MSEDRVPYTIEEARKPLSASGLTLCPIINDNGFNCALGIGLYNTDPRGETVHVASVIWHPSQKPTLRTEPQFNLRYETLVTLVLPCMANFTALIVWLDCRDNGYDISLDRVEGLLEEEKVK